MNDVKNTPILIVGDSGTGKTSAADNLPVDRTIIINTEDKTLTSADADKFTTKYIRSYKLLIKTLDALIADGKPEGFEYADKTVKAVGPKYDYILIDSFTAITEIVERYAESVYQGYEQWKKYNEMLVGIIGKIKQLNQKVIVTALPEQKDVGFNEFKSYARVKGKELKYGYLESQFTVVVFTNPQYADEDIPAEGIDKGDMVECYLKYKPNKLNTSKSPRGMFTGAVSNNAINLFTNVDKYYGR